MNIRFGKPTIVFVSDSRIKFDNFKAEIIKQLPDINVQRVATHVAFKHLYKLNKRKLRRQGFDFWIPAESIKSWDKRFKRKIRKLIR